MMDMFIRLILDLKIRVKMNKKAKLELEEIAKIILLLVIFGILVYGVYYFFNKFVFSGV